MKLNVNIEIDGKEYFVGTINGNDASDAFFEYSSDYLNSDYLPISINLPKKEGRFSAEETRVYFEGLLPEGFTRASVATMLHVSDNDYISVLSSLGKECLGSIRIFQDGDKTTDYGYKELDNLDVKVLAQEGASKSAEYVVESHLSLAGATGKVGLYLDEKSNKWFLPYGNAPSTHIIKQSHVRLNDIVVNEQLTLLTAQRLGIDVCDSFIINTEDYREPSCMIKV